jgi:hypothetical protein
MKLFWSILNAPIPGLKRGPRRKRAPWVLRNCPDSKRRAATLVFTFAGLIAHLIFFVAGSLGILLLPLIVAAQHPDAPVAAPIRWLRESFSHDTALFIYAVIWGVVLSVLVYAMKVFDYLCDQRRSSDEISFPDTTGVA